MQNVLLTLFLIQALLGSIDTLVNHELIARLPRRNGARSELALHAARELVYCALFALAGWLTLTGAAAAIALALLVSELIISATDEWVENSTRVLPSGER